MPNLPATNLATNCYYFMFRYCYNLTGDITLPATTLQSDCYRAMFSGTKITSAVLPAENLVTRCNYFMFQNCQFLTSVSVSFSNWNEDLDSTYQWFSGSISSTGTFYKPSALAV